MPGGFSSSAPIGLAVFTAIKFVGYSAFALYLNKLFSPEAKNFLYVGLCRTLIGLFFGTILGFFGFAAILITGIPGLIVYVLVLIPLRAFEWWLIIGKMYGIEWREPSCRKGVVTGIICSFILDIPALAGFFATGGFWIC